MHDKHDPGTEALALHNWPSSAAIAYVETLLADDAIVGPCHGDERWSRFEREPVVTYDPIPSLGRVALVTWSPRDVEPHLRMVKLVMLAGETWYALGVSSDALGMFVGDVLVSLSTDGVDVDDVEFWESAELLVRRVRVYQRHAALARRVTDETALGAHLSPPHHVVDAVGFRDLRVELQRRAEWRGKVNGGRP